jgi:hypothetical protein
MRLAVFILFVAAFSTAQTADRKFWIVTGLSASATSADALTTILQVGHSRNCPYEIDSAALYGRQPKALRTSLVMGGLFLASAALSYGLKRRRISRLPLWAAPEGYLAYGHTLGAIHNLRVCH